MANINDIVLLIMNYAETKVNDLCNKYGFPAIKIEFGPVPNHPDWKGAYDHNWSGNGVNKIYINLANINGPKELDVTIYHEFRHCWQAYHYYMIYLWWCETRNSDVYDKYYDTVLCVIEEDARVYGYSLGKDNREDLLQMYDYDDMDNIKSSGEMDLALDMLSMGYTP